MSALVGTMPMTTVPTGWDHGEPHRKPALPIPVPDLKARLHAQVAQNALDEQRRLQSQAINQHQMLSTLHSSLAAQRQVQADLASQREQQQRHAEEEREGEEGKLKAVRSRE